MRDYRQIVAILDADNVLLTRFTVPGAANMAHRLLWDGGKFVWLEGHAIEQFLHGFDENGVHVMTTGPLDLSNAVTREYSTGTRGFVAVAEGDYLIGYGYQSIAGNVTRLARVVIP